jgi:hypothetical protein
MVEQAEEATVTYLNKGQTYHVSMVDAECSRNEVCSSVEYRTSIWVSFQDQEQRENPARLWEIWSRSPSTKKTSSAPLHAVTFVDTVQSAKMNGQISKPRLEANSVDGFTVRWAAEPGRQGACNISLKLEFLSTDFSQLKGVEGAPNRLCVETEVLTSTSPVATTHDREIYFCQIKVFRQHGAERKASIGIANVQKRIMKVKMKLAEPDRPPKRRRNAIPELTSGPDIHSNMTGVDKSLGSRRNPRSRLQAKLLKLQNMILSPQAVSTLYPHEGRQNDYDPAATQRFVHDMHVIPEEEETKVEGESEAPQLVKSQPRKKEQTSSGILTDEREYSEIDLAYRPSPQRLVRPGTWRPIPLK